MKSTIAVTSFPSEQLIVAAAADNDDASTSSTVPTTSSGGAMMLKKPQHLQLCDRQGSDDTLISIVDDNSSNSKRKFVQFAAETTEFSPQHDIVLDNNNNNNTTWYSAQDYSEFKQDCKRVCREIIVSDISHPEQRESRTAVQAVFAAYNRQAAPEDNDIAPQDDDDDEQRLFDQWIATTPHRLGLEVGSNRYLTVQKAERRTALLDTVLNLQHTARQLNDDDNDNNNAPVVLPADVLAQVIADACAPQTRPSRLLARRVGAAQARNC
mmetsp:Transcript_1796/g.4247  ORF Transcript_1796/g.4247 Transcript_1796/m.4247 type:complete len:268 (+) Transcript_1796:94-897(+)